MEPKVHTQSHIVAVFRTSKALIQIADDAYRDKTPEELKRVEQEAQLVACGILHKAIEREEDV